MAERLTALAETYQRGDLSTARGDRAGIIIAERRPLAMVQVTAWSGAAVAVLAGIAAALDLTVPSKPNHAAQKDGVTVLWVGPDRWLVVETERPGRELGARLKEALTSTPATLIDLGHGRTVFRIAGCSSRNLLAKGCGVDFHSRAFPVDSCAQSLLGHVGALIHAVDEAPSFDLYVARSFALTVWEWLTESAIEYGCRIENAIS
ncbi:MAG TPA: sarcosine oxidase subunit gamma family protein [Acidothermaceae bacterium]|nr:sarcosine oxidase subunit gamma family protein [Acidothermaceae bacterium]